MKLISSLTFLSLLLSAGGCAHRPQIVRDVTGYSETQLRPYIGQVVTLSGVFAPGKMGPYLNNSQNTGTPVYLLSHDSAWKAPLPKDVNGHTVRVSGILRLEQFKRPAGWQDMAVDFAADYFWIDASTAKFELEPE